MLKYAGYFVCLSSHQVSFFTTLIPCYYVPYRVLQIICYILDNYEPSLEEKIKAKAEVDGVELSDLQGLSLTGQAVEVKQVKPGDAKKA